MSCEIVDEIVEMLRRCAGNDCIKCKFRKNLECLKMITLLAAHEIEQLAEYGKDNFDLVDDAVEITHWMPLPEAPEEGGKA